MALSRGVDVPTLIAGGAALLGLDRGRVRISRRRIDWPLAGGLRRVGVPHRPVGRELGDSDLFAVAGGAALILDRRLHGTPCGD